MAKDIRKVTLTLTSPLGNTRTITAVSMNPAQTSENFAHSDPDMNGNVVTIITGSTATTIEVVVRQNSGNSNFLNKFVDDCLATSLIGSGVLKNTSAIGKTETQNLIGVSVAKKESGQHDSSNVDVTFTVLAESAIAVFEG